MDRDASNILINWKNSKKHYPLLIRGARQVGKTYLIDQFGEQHFESYVKVNLEHEPQIAKIFHSLDPNDILNAIRALKSVQITPGKTLLFIDEIQESPEAILSLRYFKEQLPEMHVIAAGSLLEFVLNAENFSMPVGRVQNLFLKPLSFMEFLSASGFQSLREMLGEISLAKPINDGVHERLNTLVREYLIVGGMPDVVDTYLDSKNMEETQAFQSMIYNNYRVDFGKYAKKLSVEQMQLIFDRVPRFIASDFEYKTIHPELRAEMIRRIMYKFREAGLVYLCHAVSASAIPLAALIKEKKFKLFLLDVGLMMRACQLSGELLLQNDIILVNRGAVAEQFVGQELLAYGNWYEPQSLYYWKREKTGSKAEVDFVIAVDEHIVPVEVKSGATGRLRSLKLFIEEKGSQIGVRISQRALNYDGKILSVPFYLISELPRLVRMYMNGKL